MVDRSLIPQEKGTERSGVPFSCGGDSISPPATGPSSARPNPEVSEKPARRRFTAEYKLRILKEVETSTKPGEVGAILRREGLYSSNLTNWRHQKEKGILCALTPKKRGPKANKPHPLARRVAELEREKQQLQQRLKQTEIIIDAQKKISELLECPLTPENGGNK